MIKSFSGQVVFCFAILRAISAYVGENWLSQYISTWALVRVFSDVLVAFLYLIFATTVRAT